LPKKSTVLEVIEGDESSLEDVKKLVHGCDAVLSTLGSNDGFWNQTKQTTYYSTTAATIVKACQEESVKRLIGMTSSGVEHDNDAPLLYRATTRRMHMPTFRDMNKMEDIIEDSKLEWTLVRPSKLIHDKSKEFRVRDRANPKKGRKISHRDTAKFMVDEAEENKWINQHPALAY
jgi:putative NADH-flavin reductase